MNENTLRARAEKLRTFSDAAWRFLVSERHVEDALGRDFDEDQVTEIVKAIDGHKASMWGSSESGGASSGGPTNLGDAVAYSGPFAVRLTDAERERASLLEDAHARAASKHPRIQGFRERYLPNGLLTSEEAEQFLESNPQEAEAVGSYLHKYHGWHEGDAKWWALTGEAPTARPVRVGYRTAHSMGAPGVYLITIEAPPWVSAETVRGAFSEMRRRMRAERKPRDARSIRVARFVENLRHSPATAQLTLAEMCHRWDEDNPDEAFSEPRTFERTYQRTNNILRQKYDADIEREETPNMERQATQQRKWPAEVRRRDADRPPPKSVGDAPVRSLE